MTDSELTLEERFAKLDKLLKAMEDPSVSLEASFDMYSKGMQLLKECNESIDRIEKNLITLEEDAQ